MHRIIIASVVAISLAGCSSPTTPTIPPSVQAACSILGWAEPLAEKYLAGGTDAQKKLLADAVVALGECSAGNASVAIVDVANALYDYFTAKGIRPPRGMHRVA